MTERLGLGLHETSPALSFGLTVGSEGEITHVQVMASRVRVKRLSYREANERLHEAPFADLVAIKYRSWRSAFLAAYNELLFRCRRESGYRLVSANFEVTNACNLSCTICPVNQGMRRRKARLSSTRVAGIRPWTKAKVPPFS